MMRGAESGSSDGPAFSGIHHVNLTVTELERSAQWYQEVLGLRMGWEMPDTDGRGQKIALLHPTNHLRIVLSVHRSGSGDRFSEFRTGLDHLAFTVTNREELEAWRQRFEEMGVEVSSIKEGATGWLITFRDPDNIQLEMYTQSK